jgi:phosphoenolpyruvate carboxylase
LPLARYNFEELFTASLEERLFPSKLAPEAAANKKSREMQLMDELSQISLDAYRKFKEHPLFVPYLEEITPLKYISRLNIASRPTRRQAKGNLKFEDLRAIPFVSSWAQMKQNIPGYYGMGSALEKLIGDGRMEDVTWLYNNSLFFKTLVENAMQSLAKSRMELTSHLSSHPTYGEFWSLIQLEVNRCRSILKTITGQKKLMDNVPHIRASIDLREEVVLPLLVIQQYALTLLRENKGELDEQAISKLEKLVLKALATNINASRNSA